MSPYALQETSTIELRRAQLCEPHIRPLEHLLEEMRSTIDANRIVPHFDPLDAGINAEMLMLLEAPGGKAVGSSFVSRDNPDPTARNLSELLQEADIDRNRTLIWNIVPWYVGTGKRIRAVTAAEVEEAMPWLERLLNLLPQLKVIVLMGRKAQRAEARLRQLRMVEILPSLHPSNVCLNRKAERRPMVLDVLRHARERLDAGRGPT